MSLTGFLINFMTTKSAQRFEAATKDPVGVQTDKILNMVQMWYTLKTKVSRK